MAATCSACEDVGQFSTDESESYCGSVVLGSTFRTGLSPRVQMRLHLDVDRLEANQSPGALSTFEAAQSDEPERRLFSDVTLRPIASLENDPLSRLEFGDDRERNAIFAVTPTEPDNDPMLAILSLRSDETVEVRLLRAGGDVSKEPELAEGQRPVFGVFPLTRREGRCGF